MDRQDRSATPIAPRSRQARTNVCTQCRRQKQKCDRSTPCSNCVRRGIPHLCHLPQDPQLRSPQILDSARSSHIIRSPSARLQSQYSTTTQPPPSPSSTRVGRLWNSRGAPTYHGSSYFGYQSAADIIQVESPQLPFGMSGIRTRNGRRSHYSPRSERGLYALVWDLFGYLPRRKAHVDNLVKNFLKDLNPVYDSLHEETFLIKYEAFWSRKWGDDDLATIDLRWLALLFIVLAFGDLLDCPLDASPETESEYEESSLQLYWASRTALTLAMTFTGESSDVVRAGILMTRYLVYFGRKTESWLTSSFAIRFAQAQGMHVDGESWGLPPKVLETRRRLWSTLYTLDRFISLALGRPATVNDNTCMEMKIKNVWIDDKTDDEAWTVEERPQQDPTPSVYYIYQQKLAVTLGHIHDECFGLTPLTTSYNTYEKVLNLDKILLEWADSLPAYFRFERPDCSMDVERPYLYWQRMYLHSSFHFARVTLHRTYVLLESLTDRFQYSRDACISSACADLKLKLGFRNQTIADRLKAGAGMHNLCSSALVLGIIAVRNPFSPRTGAIIQDLAAYCEKQNADSWANEFVLAEVRVVELCIASTAKTRKDAGFPERRTELMTRIPSNVTHTNSDPTALPQSAAHRDQPLMANTMSTDTFMGAAEAGIGMEIDDDWLEKWFGPTRNFPEPGEFELWENLVGTLENLQ